MTQLDAPAIEPLSDISWQRIENGVFDRLDREPVVGVVSIDSAPRRRRAYVAVAAITAAAAAVLLFFVLRSDDSQPEVAVPVVAPTDATPAKTAPSRIVTTEAPSTYNVADSSLTIAPQSAILVSTDPNDSVMIVLERGEIGCKVAPRRADQTFAIVAGDVRVEVVGTEFAVSRSGDDVKVSVTEGTVLVVSGGERASVTAGHTWPTPEPVEPKVAKTQRHKSPKAPPKPTAKERFRTAQRLQSTDPKAAAAIFGELTKRGGPWANQALFAHAELERELGHKATAKKLYKRYLRRYPKGQHVEDAREELKQLN